MYDLTLTGGCVVNPRTGSRRYCDVAIANGKVAAIGDIAVADVRRVIDVRHKLVTPGLIDLHAHVADGATANSLEPDVCGVYSGVTTVVDAGSTGSGTFDVFPRHIIPKAHTRVLPFVHIGRTGLSKSPDVVSRDDIDVDGTRAVLERHRGLIAGIKVRLVSPAISSVGLEMLRLAKSLADDAHLPVMVHIGDTTDRGPAGLAREALPLLGPGDIVTHAFTGHPGGILDPAGQVIKEAYDAAERGVWFDTAHGRSNFSFETARRVLGEGLIPHTISTDLTVAGRRDIVHCLTGVMSRFLGFGFSVDDVIRMSTFNSARAARMEEGAGCLDVGSPADISVLDVLDGDWEFADSFGGKLRTERAFVPVLTVRAGRVFTPAWGPRPWGWEPKAA